MKINWHPNPLLTTITMAPEDKEIFRLKWKVETLQNAVWGGLFHLKDGDSYYDPKKAAEELDRYAGDDWEKSERYDYLMRELEDGIHSGDCTCVPATCYRCVAERICEVDTIPGLGKHQASKIGGAFTANPNDINAAIEHLANYEPTKGPAWANHSQAAFDAHVPRWKAEAKDAHTWLVKYRDEHFPALLEELDGPESEGRG